MKQNCSLGTEEHIMGMEAGKVNGKSRYEGMGDRDYFPAGVLQLSEKFRLCPKIEKHHVNADGTQLGIPVILSYENNNSLSIQTCYTPLND